MGKNGINVVVVTGLSGSGKSTAIKAFEDIGYFCIDNLPVPLVPSLISLCENEMPEIHRLALGIDIRERHFLQESDKVLSFLETTVNSLEILFLEASDDILQRRFSQTRRLHPAEIKDSHLVGAILHEREQLRILRSSASRIIDTSTFSVHQLKDLINRYYSRMNEKERLSVQVLSFGFKYGLPLEADLVMDVRFLPNPFYIEELKEQNGRDPAVENWVMEQPATQEFLDDYTRLLFKLMPLYISEGKQYITIAIGCTGGKHRSVALTHQLGERLRDQGYFVVEFHRDINLE